MTEKPRPDTLETAEIRWSDGQPLSTRFDDVYYSRDNGLRESRHVFMAGNNLPERWRHLAAGNTFTIFETGFGTGLNFLCAAAHWLDSAPPGARLQFVSVEKYPLSAADIASALTAWPELTALTEALLANYPPAVKGVHRRWLFDGKIALTLVFDDAISGFESLLASNHPLFVDRGNPCADAWFLDGFAPSKNPDLWTEELFRLMARFSRKETTFATFTVARQVRNGLSSAGFSLEKRPGFGRKRDMLCGVYQHDGVGKSPPQPAWVAPKILRNSRHEPTWHLRLAEPHLAKPEPRREAVVIGGGIAGCSTAAALKKRGWKVSIVDSHPEPGQEASGNPQGILYPKLSVEDSPLARFGLHALCHALGFYQRYWQSGNGGGQCGVLVLPEDDGEQFEVIAARFSGATGLVKAVTGGEIDNIAGTRLSGEKGLYFPSLGWVEPPALCRWLAEGIPFVKGDVARLARDEGENLWLLLDNQGNSLAASPLVVIASSFRSREFEQCRHLPLRPIRGQITSVPVTSHSLALKTVICGAGYLAPSAKGLHTLGATYDIDQTETDVRVADHDRNFQLLEKTDGALAELLGISAANAAGISGRAGVRCATPDYLPLAGPAPDMNAFAERFADFRRNGRADIPLAGCYLPNLWLNCGLGSRGLTYGPMAAELIASSICGEPSPLPRDLVMALSPARFIIRNIKRNTGMQPGRNSRQ